MRLVLGLPGLLAADPVPPLPGLARLLRAAGSPAGGAPTIAHALAQDYGVERAGDWPLAALRLAALGHDPKRDWWLAADPVTLVAGSADVRLAGAVTDLSTTETEALVDALNAHFATDGLSFVAATPDAWFVGSATAHAVTTHPLACAIGRPLRALLPDGPAGRTWRRWSHEIEMLLSPHPVNRARDAAGRAVANGLWWSDGGALPAGGRSPGATFADDRVIEALAAHGGEQARAVPADLAAARRAAATADSLVVVLPSPLDTATLEAAWTRAAWEALLAGELDPVVVVADGDGRALTWTATRPGLWARFAARATPPALSALLRPAPPQP